MKKVLLGISVFLFMVAACVVGLRTSAQKRELAVAVSPHLVISQFQTGRTNPNSNDEFIEIHNTSAAPVDLSGYKIVYRTANPSDITFVTWASTTIIPPGGFHLIASVPGYDGAVAPDTPYAPATCMCSLGGADRGLAIRDSGNNIIDAVGWGNFTNLFFEGTTTTSHPVNNDDNAKARKQAGCQDTDNNSTDFETVASSPRNASSPVVQCSGGGTNIFAAMSANPSTVVPGNPTLLTVLVVPAATPPSTGINVTGDLISIGGSGTQQFFDNGTNGDVTAGDNVWSFNYTIPANLTGGVRTVFGTATDAQARSVTVNTNININAPLPDEDPLILGNPSNATPDVANENNYLMVKPQYSLSYNRSRATANWVAWRLDSQWVGAADRQNDYRPDASLPAGWYQVLTEDFSGSGFDRGHMCPSGDRTRSIPDNSATFLMTNLIPQAANNNQGPWEELETYCRTLASQGKELYIFSGVAGQGGTGLNGFANTIAGGRITVPATTWKVIVVLPNGSNDLYRISKLTRVIAVVMPNNQNIGINTPWRNFRTRVKAVEALTGYNFFTNVRPMVREMIKQRRDAQ